jgi:osmotically-inducible protein OsmY
MISLGPMIRRLLVAPDSQSDKITTMKHTIKLGAIALAVGLSAAEVASAQSRGYGPPLQNPVSGGSSYAGGVGGIGSSGFGGLGSSTTGGAFGQRSVGGMPTGGGAGSFTGSQQQSMITGQLTNLDALMNSSSTSAILNFQTSAFVGSSVVGNNGANFVGSLASRGINPAQNGAMQGGLNGQRGGGQLGAGQYGGAGGQYGAGGYGQQNNRNNNRQQNANAQGVRSRTEIPIATSYTIGFSAPTAAPTAISTKITDQLNRWHSIASAGGVNVQVVGKTAVLQGTVPSDHDRDMAAQMAMLEPGVSQVKNELQVTGSAPRGASLTGSVPASNSATVSAPALAAPQNSAGRSH